MSVTDDAQVGGLLRMWRERRRLSQLELSARAGVSSRHLSFLETGRSRPTPQMIDRLATQLDVPLRERNQLLLSAGFAPAHPERSIRSPELYAVSVAFQRILDAHMPFPALVLDRWWNIVDRNPATDVVLRGCASHLLEPPVNAVLVTLHPEGLAPRIRNLAQWRTHLLGQVRSRAEHTGDARLHQLVRDASALGEVEESAGSATDVVLPLELDRGGDILRLFSIAAALQSATDITIDELHIEAFYPADQATAAWFGRLGS
ncbi:helix-turn-helix domain-containing protein [Agromyces silvae]|uniref:helix-turn-helix domain-containing protein n=1 Tax=Agromyces silvae TaxID=3388266 RepID=UPI00280B22F3|nr:helix-turn-helix transcriptional regulator [Agromyces protaetiae]